MFSFSSFVNFAIYLKVGSLASPNGLGLACSNNDGPSWHLPSNL